MHYSSEEMYTMDQSELPGPQWFALFVRPNHEFAVSYSLRAKGYEEFVPTYSISKRHRDGEKRLVLPLFPGYVFCRCDWTANYGAKIVTTPGVIRVVGTSRSPLPLAEEEVTAIRAMTQAPVAVRPYPFLNTGDEVILLEGPLRGLKAYVLNADAVMNLVVSIDLLQRSVAITVPREWVGIDRNANLYRQQIQFCCA